MIAPRQVGVSGNHPLDKANHGIRDAVCFFTYGNGL